MNNIDGNIPRARAAGLKIVAARPNQLQIDLDGARALREHGLAYKMLEREGLTRGWRCRLSQSRRRGHCHVTIDLPGPLPLGERIALQILLRSDWKREIYNWLRHKKGSRMPVVFFEAAKRTRQLKAEGRF